MRFLLATLLLGCGCEQVPDPRLFIENKRAHQQLEGQNYLDAKDHFAESLKFDPFLAETHANLGVTFLLSQDPDRALQLFKKSEELTKNPALKFLNFYNQGVVHGMQGRIDEAIQAYQKSLDIIPDSKEAKTNIELLLQGQKDKKGEGQGDSKDQDPSDKDKGKSDKESDKDKDADDKSKKEKPKSGEYKASKKYQPREFKGELNPSDVNKILGEIKSQEQKIRSQYNKSDKKEQPRDKDW